MEERYELRGRIGQGGIGSVHRAYDHKLKREVAIKRILNNEDDPSLKEESTKQLTAEAEALASLQHPHIVTILDVGSDDQGPYVVMELLTGKTLDEIIENGPMTWPDFKEIATQSLEGLIAAQELDLIHSDLKPANIMLTWLPSGKFQVKILDFGLAVLIRNQSQEEIEQVESVFGSIFFMPPEQFERKTLDERSDLYSLGCCFYQALAGTYPFNGETGSEVMDAHLDHTVQDIQELRNDIPVWASQWVMWLINRDRDNRPATARDALANFLHNDKDSNPALSHGSAKSKRSKLVIPKASMAPPPELTNPQLGSAMDPDHHSPADVEAGDSDSDANDRGQASSKKQSKIILKMAIAAAIVLIFSVFGVVMNQRNEKVKKRNTYSQIISMAAKDDVTEVPVNGEQLQTFLEIIGTLDPKANREPAWRALMMAKATDGTKIDAVITEFATTAEIPASTRLELFREVIALRGTSKGVPDMLKFATATDQPDLAVAAINASGNYAQDEHVDALLKIIASTSDPKPREAAESVIQGIIFLSKNRNDLADLITKASKQADRSEAREMMERLLQKCSPGKQASKPSTSSSPKAKPTPPTLTNDTSPETQKLIAMIRSKDVSEQIAAIEALPKTGSIAAHQALLQYIGGSKNAELKIKAIEAIVQLNSHPDILNAGGQAQKHFKQIMSKAKLHEEKKPVIEALGNIRTSWAVKLLKKMNQKAAPETKPLIKEQLEKLQQSG